jgi:hypothetical protein
MVIVRAGITEIPCDKWVPVTTARRVLMVWIEERPPIWRVAANILNNRKRPTKGGSPAWRLCEGLTTAYCENGYFLGSIQTWTDTLGCGGMDWIKLAQDRGRWWKRVNAVMNLRVT